MKTLKFAPDLVPLVVNGSKTSTWRFFDDKDLKEGDVLSFVDRDTREEFAKAEITFVKETTLGELTDEDKRGHESFSSDEEMYDTYKKHYSREVTPKTTLKIVRFKLL